MRRWFLGLGIALGVAATSLAHVPLLGVEETRFLGRTMRRYHQVVRGSDLESARACVVVYLAFTCHHCRQVYEEFSNAAIHDPEWADVCFVFRAAPTNKAALFATCLAFVDRNAEGRWDFLFDHQNDWMDLEEGREFVKWMAEEGQLSVSQGSAALQFERMAKEVVEPYQEDYRVLAIDRLPIGFVWVRGSPPKAFCLPRTDLKAVEEVLSPVH